MTSVAIDHFVSIAYTLKDATSGEVLDETSKSAPLSYLHGRGELVPGLEAALEGKVAGDAAKITLDPAEGYGARDNDRVITVPRDRFNEAPEVGTTVQASGANGHPLRFTVAEVDANTITLDGNHPLAGRTLTFDLEIVSVREATELELNGGQNHCSSGSCGGGCHC